LNELQAKNVSQKPVVLLIHGLIDSSDSWLVNGRENSIGFILADAGYDVWMANTEAISIVRGILHLIQIRILFIGKML
jgi:pimeloyl-ACP methyl ester carboxylesterase